jgi:hypothetical protein
MSANDPGWYHCNRYDAQSVCEHCEGVVRHARWCITRDPNVRYAFEVILDPAKLSPVDVFILHSLGVVWGVNRCSGACQPSTSKTSTT